MRLGLVSDTHDNLPLASRAADLFRREGVDAVVHLGDVTTALTVAAFDGLPIRFLRGNNDGDRALATALADRGLPLEDVWTDEVAGVRVGATHGHLAGAVRRLAATSDVVLHGHTHRRRAERVDGTLFVNPGALHRASVRTVALLDLPEARVRFFEVLDGGARALD